MSTEAQKETVIPPEYLLDPASPEAQPQQGSAPAQTPVPNPEDDIPEKLRGKTPAELVKLYRETESELGRARNEIGHVRRLADELLGINRAVAAKPADANPPQRKPLTTDDLWQDPEKAVVEVVRQEAQSREAATVDRVARLEYDLNLSRFELKHPDYKGTMQDPKFVEWLQRSPLRTGLAQSAVQGNFAAADELLSLYKEMQPAGGPAERHVDPTEQARNASLTRAGGSTSGHGGQPSDRQIWSRAKLLDMRINNPEEFDRLSPEINKAYAEKRVR